MLTPIAMNNPFAEIVFDSSILLAAPIAFLAGLLLPFALCSAISAWIPRLCHRAFRCGTP